MAGERAASDETAGALTRRAELLLRERIARSDVGPGDALPGEHSLAAELGVSRTTIRRALDTLAAEGVVTRRRGSATVVTRRPAPPTPLDPSNLRAYLVDIGTSSRVRLLAYDYAEAPSAVRAALDLPAGARAQRAVRVREDDAGAISYLTTHVPEALAKGISETDMASQPLYALLERAGADVASARQTVSAAPADRAAASALGVTPGAPLLEVTRAVFDADGRGVEHLHALYRPDRHRIEFALSRVGEGDGRRWKAAS